MLRFFFIGFFVQFFLGDGMGSSLLLALASYSFLARAKSRLDPLISIFEKLLEDQIELATQSLHLTGRLRLLLHHSLAAGELSRWATACVGLPLG